MGFGIIGEMGFMCSSVVSWFGLTEIALDF